MSQLKRTLIRLEGLELKPYRCTEGYLTIGVGRNLESVGLSKDEAMYLLEADIMRATTGAMKAIPGFLVMNSARQDVLIMMIFQLGMSGFLKFRRMIAAILKADYNQAAVEMLDSQWAKQTPARAKELAEMMGKADTCTGKRVG
jgi:lysozyme